MPSSRLVHAHSANYSFAFIGPGAGIYQTSMVTLTRWVDWMKNYRVWEVGRRSS
jgi:hypothetical protein